MGGFLSGPIGAMAGLAANTRSQGQRDAMTQALSQLRMQQLAEQNQYGQFQNDMTKILADPNAKPEDVARALRTLAPAQFMTQLVKGGANQALSGSYSALADSEKNPLKKAALQQAANAAAAGARAPEIKEMLTASGLFTDADLVKYRQLRNQMLGFQVDILNKLIKSGQIDKALELMGAINARGTAPAAPDTGTASGGGTTDDFEPVTP